MPPTKSLEVFDGHKLVLFGNFWVVKRYSVWEMMRLLECLVQEMLLGLLNAEKK